MDSVSALDAKVPDYVWTEVIARDICMYRIGAPSGTFVVELLSDMEFLLFQGPRSGPGIAWEDTICYLPGEIKYIYKDQKLSDPTGTPAKGNTFTSDK